MNSCDPEIERIIKRLERNDLQVFNYDFVQKYKNLHFQIEFDESCGMYFVFHEGKRLYFSKAIKDKEEAADYYMGVLMEQDQESPHKYIDESFQVEKGNVVVDIGVAEGNFSLQVIELVSRLYIIEADDGLKRFRKLLKIIRKKS